METPKPLQTIIDTVNEAGQKLFPFFSCSFSGNLGDSIYLWGSLDPQDTWKYGYRENSRMFAAHVFCSSHRYHENCGFEFAPSNSLGRRINGRMIARKNADPDKLATYIIKQLTKIAEANS